MRINYAVPFDREKTLRRLRSTEIGAVLTCKLEPYFFTFGAGQAFPDDVVCIWARSQDRAREKMFELFGEKWSFDYDLESIVGYVNDCKPTKIRLIGEYVQWLESDRV